LKLFSVELSQNAEKFLNKLDKQISERIKARLKKLGEQQVPSDSKFITKHEGDMVFRYRIGDFRALYKIKESEKVVLIAKIDKRPRIYDREI
jgi:mRNA interferase RelE/StbE